jgi:hypothetical protein
MKAMTRLTGVLALAVAIAGPAFAQGAASPKGQTYDVSFSFNNGTTYTGTMSLAVTKGKVTGRMAIDSPAAVTGDVAGTLKGPALALDYPYTVEGDQPCTGRVTVTATFDAKRTAAKGTAHAEGCGNSLDGTVTLTKPSR